MRPQDLQTFLEKAQDRLSGIRGSLLLFSQGRSTAAEVTPVCHRLVQLQFEADSAELPTIGRFAAEAACSIEHAVTCPAGLRDEAVKASLDLISKLEAEVLQIPLGSKEFLAEAEDLVESTFAGMIAEREKENSPEEFEVDEETLEIFREERLRGLAHQHRNLIPQRVALELTRSHEQAIETLIATTDVVGAQVHDPALRLAVQLELAKVRTAPKIAIAFVARAIAVNRGPKEAEIHQPAIRTKADLAGGRGPGDNLLDGLVGARPVGVGKPLVGRRCRPRAGRHGVGGECKRCLCDGGGCRFVGERVGGHRLRP